MDPTTSTSTSSRAQAHADSANRRTCAALARFLAQGPAEEATGGEGGEGEGDEVDSRSARWARIRRRVLAAEGRIPEEVTN